MLVCSNTEAKEHNIERHDANNKSQCHGTVLNPVGWETRCIEGNVKEILKAETHLKELSHGNLDTFKITFKFKDTWKY